MKVFVFAVSVVIVFAVAVVILVALRPPKEYRGWRVQELSSSSSGKEQEQDYKAQAYGSRV